VYITKKERVPCVFLIKVSRVGKKLTPWERQNNPSCTLKQQKPIGEGDQELEKRLIQEELI
jgi:hypothetical protein